MRMYRLTPSLLTTDLEATVSFYRDRLGFTVDTLWPEQDPQVAILDHGSIHLLFHTPRPDGSGAAPDPPPERPTPALTGELRFDVEGVSELHGRLAGEVEVLWGPEVYHYGRREFSIRDPNGYALVFSEPTDDPVTCPEP